MEPRLFNLDPQLLADALLLGINVFFLFLVASYLLFNPARKMLKTRQDKIKDQIDTAAQDKEKASKLKAEYDEKLKAADKEVETILSDARKKAVRNENKIIEEAKAEAARIMERANADIALEKKRAMDEVKQDIISIASMMAGKVVTASIDTTVHDGLLEETLKEMGESTWQS